MFYSLVNGSFTRVRIFVNEYRSVMGRRKVSNLLALAVLAVLAERPMHRYEMASLMRARGKDRDMNIKWGSLYTVVSNMEKHGLLESVGVTRQGARPERTVYQITEDGRRELVEWARELVADPQIESASFTAGLSVLSALSPEDATGLLRQRLTRLTGEVAAQHEERARYAGDIPPSSRMNTGQRCCKPKPTSCGLWSTS